MRLGARVVWRRHIALTARLVCGVVSIVAALAGRQFSAIGTGGELPCSAAGSPANWQRSERRVDRYLMLWQAHLRMIRTIGWY